VSGGLVGAGFIAAWPDALTSFFFVVGSLFELEKIREGRVMKAMGFKNEGMWNREQHLRAQGWDVWPALECATRGCITRIFLFFSLMKKILKTQMATVFEVD
jgi:hypothetical protein